MKILLVVDVQHDFVDGALGSAEAQAAIPYIRDKVDAAVEEGNTLIVYTRDTHFNDYMDSDEGKFLPVPHCIRNTPGWQIMEEVDVGGVKLDKLTFGLKDIDEYIEQALPNVDDTVTSIEIVGFCTDICVISNALLLKAAYATRGVPIFVDAKGCAGVTPEKHAAALEVMKSCQIIVKE